MQNNKHFEWALTETVNSSGIDIRLVWLSDSSKENCNHINIQPNKYMYLYNVCSVMKTCQLLSLIILYQLSIGSFKFELD